MYHPRIVCKQLTTCCPFLLDILFHRPKRDRINLHSVWVKFSDLSRMGGELIRLQITSVEFVIDFSYKIQSHHESKWNSNVYARNLSCLVTRRTQRW